MEQQDLAQRISTCAVGSVTDTALVARTKQMTRDLRRYELQLLICLAEIDTRRLYAPLGFSSLFAYCRSELGLAEGTASRYIASARMLRRYPQIEGLLLAGRLHTTAVGMIAPYLRELTDAQQGAARIDAVCGKTKREIEALVAAWSAKSVKAVKDSIQPVGGCRPPQVAVLHFAEAGQVEAPGTTDAPQSAQSPQSPQQAKPHAWAPVSGGRRTEASSPFAAQPEGTASEASPLRLAPMESTRSAAIERPLAMAPQSGSSNPISSSKPADRVVIRFEATSDLVAQIERAKAVLAHTDAGDTLAGLFHAALAVLLEKRDPKRKSERRKARLAKNAAKTGKGQREMSRAQALSTEPSSENRSPTESSPGKFSPRKAARPSPEKLSPGSVAAASEVGVGGHERSPVKVGSSAWSPGSEQGQVKAASSRALGHQTTVLGEVFGDAPAQHRTRHIPAALRAEVLEAAQYQCEYVGRTGRRCAAENRLEIDHIAPYAWGGEHVRENLQVLCAEHNKWRAVVSFGPRSQAP